MKKIFLLLMANLFGLAIPAQQQLHIHHINIGNGDATLIGIYDVTEEKYTSKILIDGGQAPAENMLLPYIRKMVGSDNESLHFEYIILSHYHDDHYTGLLAIQDGSMTADSIIDPGGYKVATYFKHSATGGTRPSSMKLAIAWLTALKTASHHTPEPFVKGRSKIMIRFDATTSTSLGKKIRIGKVGSNNVELECIAGWGNTLSSEGQIKRNPSPTKNSANNFTLAFILSCGQFRYFIGGDMGGSGGSYIDQETTVTKYLNAEYPVSISTTGDQTVKGHVCGFKANHHGSNYSNTAGFMEGMHPAIVITSGGNNQGWHLPNPEYIKRLKSVNPLSISANLADSTFNKGVYFTNLYNFTSSGHSYPSLTTANTSFKNKPGVSYSFGNDPPATKDSYVIKVTDEDALNEKSLFEVGRVDITQFVPYKRLAFFVCHKKE